MFRASAARGGEHEADQDGSEENIPKDNAADACEPPSLLVEVRFSFCEPSDRHDPIVGLDPDEPHALGGPPDRFDVPRAGAQHLALLGDEHQLILVAHLDDADDVPVPVGRLDVDDALAAPGLHAVLVEGVRLP